MFSLYQHGDYYQEDEDDNGDKHRREVIDTIRAEAVKYIDSQGWKAIDFMAHELPFTVGVDKTWCDQDKLMVEHAMKWVPTRVVGAKRSKDYNWGWDITIQLELNEDLVFVIKRMEAAGL